MPRGMKTGGRSTKPDGARGHFDAKKLDALIEQATVDAYGESEQVSGFYTMMEEHLALPFTTAVLGVEVSIEKVDLTERDEIVAVCAREGTRQAIPILELSLPDPPPVGAEWIEAYRRWRREE